MPQTGYHNRINVYAGQTIRRLSHRWNMARRHQAVIELLPQLNLKPLITHRIEHHNAAEAYALIDKHPEEIMQVVLTY